jgi:hypothetical protein
VILLGGGTKARQSSDIAAARAFWDRFRRERRQAMKRRGGSDGIDA